MNTYHNCSFFLCISNIMLSFLFVASIQAQTPINLNGWQPNGTVKSIAQDDDYVYLGGDFTRMIKPTVNGVISHGVGIDVNTGELLKEMPNINGVVTAIVADGVGGWYVGGDFTKVGNVVRNNLAHIKADRTLDMLWNPNPTYVLVRTLYLSGTDLYVGGQFWTIAGHNAKHLAKFSTIGAGAIDVTWKTNIEGYLVSNIVFSNTAIYISGQFSKVDEKDRKNIAKLSFDGSVDVNWNPSADAEVTKMILRDDALFVLGWFQNIGGVSRRNIAKLSASGVGMLDPYWNYQPFCVSIGEITLHGDYLYLGGNFSNSGLNIKKVSAFTTYAIEDDWVPSFYSKYISNIVIHDSYIYVAGYDIKLGNEDIGSLCRLNMDGTIDTNWKAYVGKGINTLNIKGDMLYAGGQVHGVGGIERNHIARIRKSDYELDMNWNPDANGVVENMCIKNGNIYVGGWFTQIDNTYINKVAKISLINGQVDNIWNPNMNIYSVVTCLKAGEQHLYIGGNFNGIGGINQVSLARVSLNGNGEVDTNWRPQINNWVSALELVNENLYVGGLFTNVSNTNINYVAKINSNGTIDTSWNPNPNGFVTEICASDSDIYIGGSFSNIGGENISYLAQFTISGEVNPNWKQPHTYGIIYDVQTQGNELFVVGDFGSTYSRNIAKLFKTLGAIDNSWRGKLAGIGYTTALNNKELYVGGSFRNIDGNSISGFAIYPLALAPPQNLNVVPQEPIKMNLSWTDGVGETNYVILRSTTSGSGYTEIATVDANVTTYQDALPQTPTLLTYYYVVRAKNGVLVSANSNEASAIPTNVEHWAGAEVIVSPNPVADDMKIVFSSVPVTEITLKLVDGQGKTLWQTIKKATNNEILLSLKNYPKGIYILTLEQNKKILTKKVVKQ